VDARQALVRRLEAWVSGTDRSREAAERLLDLVGAVDDTPMQDELVYGIKHATPDAVADLASIVLADLRATKRMRPPWKLLRPDGFRLLRARWATPEGIERTAAIVAALKEGRSPALFGFGTHDGRADLRAMLLEGLLRAPDDHRSAQESLMSIDFGGAELGQFWLNSFVVEDCRFDGTRYREGLGFWDGLIHHSTFRGADLTGSTFGQIGDSALRLNGVDFGRARLRRASFHGRVEDCDFSHSDLRHAQFEADLVRVRFAGLVEEAEFYGPRPHVRGGSLEEVDFSECEFMLVAIRQLDLDRVRFPEAPGHLVVQNWPRVLEKMVEIYQDAGLDPPWWVGYGIQGLGRNQQVGLVVVSDVAWQTAPAVVDSQLAILRQAQEACTAG